MKWNNIVMEKKINQKDYQFYVLNKAGTKIRSGWSYKEDAIDGKNDDEQSKVGRVVAKVTLKRMNIDPDDNKFWSTMDESKSVVNESVPYSPIMNKYGKQIVSMIKERMNYHNASFKDVKEAFKNLFNNIVEADLEDFQ